VQSERSDFGEVANCVSKMHPDWTPTISRVLDGTRVLERGVGPSIRLSGGWLSVAAGRACGYRRWLFDNSPRGITVSAAKVLLDAASLAGAPVPLTSGAPAAALSAYERDR
jgi:hypothetical protein